MSETRTDVHSHAQDNEDIKSASFGASALSTTDAALIALERQFNAILAELQALERLRGNEVVTRRIEPVLARLYPIERAIMRTPACTIAGLGVKARHAAYVMSQYWDEPIDQIDWEAQAARLLIEAVCDVARTPLPFHNLSDSE